jgi:uncharacterized membrane protein YfhO
MIFGTDFLAGGIMSREFLAESLRQYHAIPMWHPFIYGGVPYVDALAGDLFYPISFVTRLFLPAHLVVTYSYLIHIFLAGVFTYLFLRTLKVHPLAALVSGVGYMFTAQIVSLVYAGHDGKIIVSALLPLVLLLVHKAITEDRFIFFLLGGGAIGFVLLSPHIQMAYFLLAATLLYAVFLLVFKVKEKRRPAIIGKVAVGFTVMILIGFLLAAVLYVPFYSYIPYSPRGGTEGRGYEFATSWSMPPEEIINTLVPEFSGILDNYWGRNYFKLHSEYIGVLPILLCALALVFLWRDRTVLFFALLGLLAMIVAWGGHTPLYGLLYHMLPYFKKFRAMGMVLYLTSFSVVVLAGLGLNHLLSGLRDKESVKRLTIGLGIACGVALLVGVLVAAGQTGVTAFLQDVLMAGTKATWGEPVWAQKIQALQANYEEFVRGFFRMGILLLANAALIVLLVRRAVSATVWAVIAVPLLIFDLWSVDTKYLKVVESPDLFFQKDEVVQFLQQDRGLYRIFPLQYRRDNYAMLYGIQSVGGEHGNQLQSYNEFAGAGGGAMVDFRNLNYPNFLNLLNVKYLITQSPIQHPLFRPVHEGALRVYENLAVLPRAFVVHGYEVVPEKEKVLERLRTLSFDAGAVALLDADPGIPMLPPESATPGGRAENVDIVRYEPNRVTVEAALQSPGILVFCENYYPAWQAYVDGQRTEVRRAYYTLRGVPLTAGEHKVEFIFDSPFYRIGKAITLVTIIMLLGVAAVFIWQAARPRVRTSASVSP